MKRLIVCCDGTWQDLNTPYPTNVVKLTQGIKPIASNQIDQVVYYDEGVGTGDSIDYLVGGGLGKGIDKNIQDAYRFLCLNYVAGDEIYLFGFSRGAYTVRSLGGLIYNSGLLKRSHIRQIGKAYELYRNEFKPSHPSIADFRQKFSINLPNFPQEYRVPITLLACWDTVGALGIPDIIPYLPGEQLLNKSKYAFHDTTLSSIIKNALHAVAIDEERKIFDATLMNSKTPQQKLHQVWFAGDHGSIGGGTKIQSGLADITLLWMFESVKNLGLKLEFDTDLIPDEFKPNPQPASDYQNNQQGGLFDKFARKLERIRRKIPKEDEIHPTVSIRMQQRSDYDPPNLKNRV